MGRHSLYNDSLAEEICTRLAAGETLRAICQSEHIPAHSTVLGWVNDLPSFADRYARARQMGLDVIAEEIIEIADESSSDTVSSERGDMPNSEWIARSRLRVDVRKWLLSKLRPDKYGDRSTLDLNGKVDLTMTVAETLRTKRAERVKAGPDAEV